MVVHMTCLIAKRDDVSLDEFNAYWSEHHSKTFLGNPAAKQHLLRYSQTHLDTSLTSGLQKEGGTQTARYDGIAQFWAETKEDLLAVFASEYYREVVVEDEKKFMKVPAYELYVGEVQDCWIKDGK